LLLDLKAQELDFLYRVIVGAVKVFDCCFGLFKSSLVNQITRCLWKEGV
jgi:hypothetical protein